MIYSKNYFAKFLSKTLTTALLGTMLPVSAGVAFADANVENKTAAETTASESINYKTRPNVIIIMADDMGYSDIGCFGSEIETPNLDKLAENGIRLTSFYNGARCSPARASLLTGLYPHEAGMPHLQGRYAPFTTKGITDNAVLIPRVLKENGYGTYMNGKWHIGAPQAHVSGFDKVFQFGANYYADSGTLNGKKTPTNMPEDEYFTTDDIMNRTLEFLKEHNETKPDQPFFEYLAFTAPHFPLQAKEVDIEKYKGRFDEGWDVLRERKFQRMLDMGIIDPAWELSSKESSNYVEPSGANYEVQPWDDLSDEEKAWRLRAMEVYAALVDNLDQNIGRLISYLEEAEQLDNTLIMFFADNGGNAEFPKIKNLNRLPGPKGYAVGAGHYGLGWANYSNTPFRKYKHYVHEGGIASPFIAHWPKVIKDKGGIRRSPAQLTDIMATIVDITDSKYPEKYNGKDITPMRGTSMMSIFLNDTSDKEYLFWEHEGNCAVRYKNWKLVKTVNDGEWELYDLAKDGTEINNIASENPELVQQLSERYEKWTEECKVLPWEELKKHAKKKANDAEE